jgi:hypothetical protein
MYNSGNSSKNVTGSSIVDGTVEAADLATAVNNDIADGVAGKATADLALPKAGGTMTGDIVGLSGSGVALTGVGIGNGQTWQNLTASRALTTTYTNSTGKTIAVHFRIRALASTSFITCTVGGLAEFRQGAGSYMYTALFFIVPAGATYILNVSGSYDRAVMYELR